MKSSLAAGLLALALATTSRADASKQVHDAVRDFLDLKRYVWRETSEHEQGTKVRVMPIASGRTEVDGFTVGVFNATPKGDAAFVNFAPRTAFKVETDWKLVEDMNADEIKAIFRRATPPTRSGTLQPHWYFVAPHDILVSIVGMAPAPDWVGDKILGVMAGDDEAAMLYYLMARQQGQIEWESMPRLVRNKLGGISAVPVPGPSAAQKEADLRRMVMRLFTVRRAEYELWFRDGLISRLVLHLEVALNSRDGTPSQEPAHMNTWAFDFSEVGRVEVTPDPVAKVLFTQN